jgi:hypothetical protein
MNYFLILPAAFIIETDHIAGKVIYKMIPFLLGMGQLFILASAALK